MRIAYLLSAPGIPLYGPSGASAHVRGVVGALAYAHDVRVYCVGETDQRGRFGDPLPQVVRVRAAGRPWWPGALGRYRDVVEIGAARRVEAALRRDIAGGWVPERIIERHALFGDAGWRVHSDLGIPWTLVVNAPLVRERKEFEELRLPALARRWERRVIRAAPQVVVNSRWLFRWVIDQFGCKQVRWVSLGTEGLVGDRARGRRLLGAPEGVAVVGFVGSMKPWHGTERAAHVAQALGARLALIGHLPPDFEAPEGALLPGFLAGQDLADAIAGLDLALAPYPADAPPWFNPLKILDYRAQGVPVVATDVGDAGLLAAGGGAVVAPDDDAALVAAARGCLGTRHPPRVRSWSRVAAKVLRSTS